MITEYSSYRYFKNKSYKAYKVIDIVLGTSCNFSCKYCYQDKNLVKVKLTNEIITYIKNYIKDCIKHLPENEYIEIHLMGGEPLFYMDDMNKVIIMLSKYAKYISFVKFPTNGYYIKDTIDTLLFWNKILLDKLYIVVSNDFYLQDKNRKENTHDLIEESIKLLDDNGISFKTNTVIPFNDICYINDVYNDYLNQISKLKNRYLFDFTFDLLNHEIIDVESAELGFEKLYNNIVKRTECSNIIQFDYDVFKFQCRMYGGLITSIDTNGDLYCCSSAPFIKNSNLCIGNITKNSFYDIENNINKFLFKYKFNEYANECISCTSYCKICPIKKINIIDNT